MIRCQQPLITLVLVIHRYCTILSVDIFGCMYVLVAILSLKVVFKISIKPENKTCDGLGAMHHMIDQSLCFKLNFGWIKFTDTTKKY